MKHTKPFTCIQRSCPKHKVGFTTSNDLRRHMKALHGYRFKPSVASPSGGASGVTGGDGSVDGGDVAEVIPPVDGVGGWRCKYCAQMEPPSVLGHANSTKGFFSTRKDNFRNHIKRMHGALKRDSESMDEFFKRSEMECRVNSPVLLPTVPPSETPLAMDTDMDSPEAGIARGSGERRHGEQSGLETFGFSGRARLPSVEEWKGLPPPASSTAGTHRHSRLDTLPQDMASGEVSGRGGYHSMGGSREMDRNATSRQHQQSQKIDQPRGMGGGYYHQLHDRENVDSQESKGGTTLVLVGAVTDKWSNLVDLNIRLADWLQMGGPQSIARVTASKLLMGRGLLVLRLIRIIPLQCAMQVQW
ncbi:hypothetical protein BGX38DRAFT_145652 [Terfezia claveryi]|nr:hypothetical protein BGX38DRAFT_145652 [Terfezia claveryi]